MNNLFIVYATRQMNVRLGSKVKLLFMFTVNHFLLHYDFLIQNMINIGWMLSRWMWSGNLAV